jgi:hypothetical protein
LERQPATERHTTTDLARTAAMLGLIVLAGLLAADLLVAHAVLREHAGQLNPLGQLLVGVGGAGLVKVMLVAGLMAFVVRRRVTRLPVVCAVWAAIGVYVTVVVVNAYTLSAARGG